jgi:hypothetical protein
MSTTRTLVPHVAQGISIAPIERLLVTSAVLLGIVIFVSVNELPKFNNTANETTPPMTQSGPAKVVYVLPEFHGFGEETPVPQTAVSQYINWNKLYPVKTTFALPEFNGFGEETVVPKTSVSHFLKWDNIYKYNAVAKSGL